MDTFNVVDYLRERNYLVTIEPTEGGVEVIFPEQAIMGNSTPKMRINITLDAESEMVTIEGFCEGKLVLRNRVEVPRYAIGPYFMFYTIGVCERIQYSPEMIVFYDDNREQVSEPEFIELCRGNELTIMDTQREATLLQIVQAGRNSGWEQSYESHAEEMGVLDGYQLIRTVLGEQDEETQNFMVG